MRQHCSICVASGGLCKLDTCSERVQTSNFLLATVLSRWKFNSHCRGTGQFCWVWPGDVNWVLYCVQSWHDVYVTHCTQYHNSSITKKSRQNCQRQLSASNKQTNLLIASSWVSNALTTRIESRGSLADTDCRADDKLSTCTQVYKHHHPLFANYNSLINKH